ncbi:MAG: HEPN domain-containing protein [Bacteroidetes bacterium]|nr:HEPN domain-containing protein [Bacteroidota bacterium]
MTLSDKDRSALIKYRIEQADETIADVELLIENNRFRSAINRIYYGMFYSLLALALEYKFESSKHAQIIGWFNKNFVHENKSDEMKEFIDEIKKFLNNS